jgi:hypothetical protein
MVSGEVAKKNVDETSRKTGNSPINNDSGSWEEKLAITTWVGVEHNLAQIKHKDLIQFLDFIRCCLHTSFTLLYR